MNFRNIATRLAIAGLIAAPATSAIAAEGSGSAGVNILEALSVEELTELSFGNINRPSSGSNTFTLDHANNSVSTSGSGDGFYAGGAVSGVFEISGEAEQAVQATVSIADFADEGLTVDEAFINGASDTYSGALDEDGKLTATIGGVLTVGANAALGQHSTTVTVVVTYQ